MARKKTQPGGLVYSSEHGRMCPTCRNPIEACNCAADDGPAGDGVVRVGRETQGRKGKAMTVVTGLPLGRSELVDLGKQLKKRCGSGGTAKNGVIEIQGDHRDLIVEALKKLGYDAKRSGG